MKNIFNSKCEAIINPVNLVGVMGAGLALQFKNKYPINYQKYKEACDNKQFKMGTCLTIKENEKFIINFPTKIHYKDPSKLEYIEKSLEALERHIKHYEIKSVAFPAVGAGLGGLDWNDVKKLLDNFVKKHSEIQFEIYEPLSPSLNYQKDLSGLDIG